jgi:hypothetical protein
MIYIIYIMIILYILYQKYYDTIHVNLIVSLTVMRGILTPNKLWYSISDLYDDPLGIKLFNKLKYKNNKYENINIYGEDVKIILDINLIKNILDNSPNIYGVGKLKYNFFKSFMKYNVGVSSLPKWKKRRKLNEYVLNTNKHHQHISLFDFHIKSELQKNIPLTHNEFIKFNKLLTMKIIFGVNEIYEPIFEIFDKANSIKSILMENINIDKDIYNKYEKYIYKHIKNPNKNSLIYLASEYTSNHEEIFHQIPHWIFPINGLISVHSIRLLALLYNHPDQLDKINDDGHIRKCILELFRLNNPVNSTFRTVIHKTDEFREGEQLLILNNPILRTEDIFYKPHEYHPERWNYKLEQSYYALMFNQGKQKCPGKELAIDIITIFIKYYLQLINNYKSTKMNVNYISLINPFDISIQKV